MNSVETVEKVKERNLLRYKAVVWNEKQINKSEIAKRLGIHRQEVYRILEKFDLYGSVEKDLRQLNSGRSPLFNEQAKGEIKELIRNNGPMELEEIKESIEEELTIKASTSTISRVLSDIGKFVTPT